LNQKSELKHSAILDAASDALYDVLIAVDRELTFSGKA
jgi:hypothetical protein